MLLQLLVLSSGLLLVLSVVVLLYGLLLAWAGHFMSVFFMSLVELVWNTTQQVSRWQVHHDIELTATSRSLVVSLPLGTVGLEHYGTADRAWELIGHEVGANCRCVTVQPDVEDLG